MKKKLLAVQKAMIQEGTRGIGYRACMIACKEWNAPATDERDFFTAAPVFRLGDVDDLVFACDVLLYEPRRDLVAPAQ